MHANDTTIRSSVHPLHARLDMIGVVLTGIAPRVLKAAVLDAACLAPSPREGLCRRTIKHASLQSLA